MHKDLEGGKSTASQKYQWFTVTSESLSSKLCFLKIKLFQKRAPRNIFWAGILTTTTLKAPIWCLKQYGGLEQCLTILN